MTRIEIRNVEPVETGRKVRLTMVVGGQPEYVVADVRPGEKFEIDLDEGTSRAIRVAEVPLGG